MENTKLTRDTHSHAIIIGGSLSGLLAARVLTEHFSRVTVVERDTFPDGPHARKGLPQARHIHVLLMQGRQILEELFPGFDADLAAQGAPLFDWRADCRTHTFGSWKLRYRSGITSRMCTRDAIDWLVRKWLLSNPKVSFLQECDVIGLLADPGKRRVTGVCVRDRSGTRGEVGVELYADLVVDASGRSSRAPQWLESLGYKPPQETTVNSYFGYATRFYRPPAEFKRDWQGILMSANPPEGNGGGAICPLEDGRWIVTLGGAVRNYPPTDEEGFLQFARSLPSPIIYDAIRRAEPLTPIYGYRRTENRLRHYERLEKMPESFLVLGDAVCAFNPVYGQGMTAGALAAKTLDGCLREHNTGNDLTGLGRKFQKRLAKVNATPWAMSTGEDFRYPETEGDRPGRLTRLLQLYIDRMLVAAGANVAVDKAFLEVAHLLKSPAALFHPRVVLGVLRGGQKQRRRKPVHRRQGVEVRG